MDFIDLCKSMRIVDGTPEYMKPLNVGLMFFNDDPQKFFPYSQIEVVDLRNGPEGDDMTERIFRGPIDSMIKSALTYISNILIEEKILKVDGQAEAIRFFNYPYQAIEEALVNAVYHRGFDIREPVEVRIMEDFITTLFIHEGFENEIFSEIKTSDKTSDKIINFLKQNGYITTLIASELLGLSTQRARAVLGKMAKDEIIIAEGANKNRKYKLKNLGSK